MTVDEVLAHEGIRQTVATYAHHVDDGEFEALSHLFVEDGLLIISRFDEPPFSLDGREAIATYLARSASERAADHRRGPYRRHHVSSLQSSVGETGHATGRSYFTAVMAHGPDHWGRYEDTYRFDGQWRFVRRRVLVDGRVQRETQR